MQQTETLKLNLIETGDPISPVPLNENAEKIEAAILTGDAALDARVTVLEGHRMACGVFLGNNGTQFIDLGFTPKAVILGFADIRYYTWLAIADSERVVPYFKVVENGFEVTQWDSFNSSSWYHHFFAID